MSKTVDIIIPTYKPDKDFDKLVEMLVNQSLHPRSIIIMNSVEDDEDYLCVPGGKPGDPIQVFNIRKSEFDHGHTRNLGVSHSTADYFVCMTQDAIPCDYDVIRNLVETLEKKPNESGEHIAMAYARQIPRMHAGDIEKITRKFNYPAESTTKTQRDLDKLGIKTFFASNVCCCYDRAVFDKLGGFIDKTDFNEDMMYGAKAIQAGYAIGYCADAQVFHSHNYTARQQYDRNFQLAVSQVLHPEYFGGIKSESEGVKLVKNTAVELVRAGKWTKISELIYMSGAKYLGYRAGRKAGAKTER